MLTLLDAAQGTSANPGVIIDLYTFTLSNGTVFRIASSDFDVTVTYPSFGAPLDSAVVSTGGSGWAAGDVANVVGGGGSQAQVLISSVSGGTATGVVVFQPGNGYTSMNSVLTAAVSPSAGVGLYLNLVAFSDIRTGTVTFSSAASIYPMPDKDGMEIKSGLGVEVDTVSLRLDADQNSVVNGVQILQQFVLGNMDDALVQIERTFVPQGVYGVGWGSEEWGGGPWGG